MRLQYLGLKGLTVFKDKTEIDFSALPSGLIAIVGDNGQGKTSAMEAIYASLTRELASRDQPLMHYMSGKDAFFNLKFLMGGSLYESTITIDAVTEKMEAYLKKDGLPVPGCDKKLKPHKAAIEKIVGSKELLLSSVFGAQGRKGVFHEIPVAERKTLFIEMLGIGQFPRKEEKAKVKVNACAIDLAEVRASILMLEEEVAKLDMLIAGRVLKQEQLSEVETERGQLGEELYAVTQVRKEHSEEAAGLRSRIAYRIQDIDVRVGVANASSSAVQRKMLDRIKDINIKKSQAGALRADLTAKIAKLEERIANNRKILADRDSIMKSVDSYTAAKKRLEDLDTEWEAAIAKENQKATINAERLVAQSSLASTEYHISQWQDSVHELKSVPCGGAGPYAQCSKIVAAVKHKEALPGMIEVAKQGKANLRVLEDKVASFNGVNSRSVLQQRTDTALEIKTLEKCVALVQPLQQAEERILELETSLKDLTAQFEAALIPDVLTDPWVHEMKLQISEYDATLVQLQEERNDPTDSHRLKELESALCIHEARVRTTEARILSLQTTKDSLVRTIDVAADQISTIQAKVPSLEKHRQREGTLMAAMADWTLIVKACSKTGIPALAIDAAGPGISAMVNDLLSHCFSTRFMVKLATQRIGAEGQLLEDFNIEVTDSLKGRQGTIDDLSGGEKVIVGEALALAIALYNKGIHPLETIFRDEPNGALDPANTLGFVQMMRRAMHLGGFYQYLVITHNPEIAEMADARIRCHDGKVTVEL